MTISHALEVSLESNTFSTSARGYYPSVSEFPSYVNNGFFSKFLQITLPYEGECFIPVVVASDIFSLITNWLISEGPTEPIQVSIPLFVGGSDTKKQADSIIQSINKCPKKYRLANIKTSKGLDYYGGNGMIFDENWDPMMLVGYHIKIDRTYRTVEVISPVCYVTPKVFEGNDILSKAILKKVIPFFSTGRIFIPNNVLGTRYYPETFSRIPVTIQYLDKFFYTPNKPVNIENLDDDIWDCLNRNIDDLV